VSYGHVARKKYQREHDEKGNNQQCRVMDEMEQKGGHGRVDRRHRRRGFLVEHPGHRFLISAKR